MTRMLSKLCYFSISIVLLLNLVSCSYDKTTVTLGSEFDNTWDFNNSANFEFDENLIEFQNGKAQLKALDLEHSGDDFNSGSHVGSHLDTTNKAVKLLNSDKSNITKILPTRASDLVGYWRFDSGFDAEVGASLTSFNGGSGLDITEGKISNAISFDGIDDYFTYPAPTLSKISASAWVRLDNYTNNFPRIIELESNFSVWVQETPNPLEAGSIYIRALHSTTNGFWFTASNTVQLGELYHIAISYDSSSNSNKPLLLINGEQVSLTAHTSPSGTFNDTSGIGYIGHWKFGTSRHWSGVMDEYAIFDVALSKSELIEIYNNQNSISIADTSLSSAWTPKWDSIVGYWKMDGNWQDSSGNGYNLTPFGDSNFTTSNKVGSHGAFFDGDNDVSSKPISSGPLQAIDLNQDITISMWVKPNSLQVNTLTKQNRILIANSTQGYIAQINYRNQTDATDANKFRVCRFNQSTASCILTTNVFDDNTYHHLVFRKKGTQIELYIDGILEGVNIDTSPVPSLVEEFELGGQGSNSEFTGEIDDVGVWNDSLSNSEILQIYNRQKQKYASHYDSEVLDLGSTASAWPDLSWMTSLPFGKELVGDFDNDGTPDSEGSSDYSGLSGDLSGGLVGYWDFNEAILNSGPAGSDYRDLSIHSNHGLESGGVSFSNLGKLRNSLLLDGTNDYVDIGADSSLDVFGPSQKFTICSWVNSSNFSSNSGILSWGSAGINGSTFFVDPSRRISFLSKNNTVSEDSIAQLSENNWHFVCVASDRLSSLKFYVDGVFDSAYDISSHFEENWNRTNDVYKIGVGRSATGYFEGKIDELSVWSRNLNDQEIQQLYRRGANRVKLQVKSCVDSSCNCKSYGAGGAPDDCDGDTILNAADNDDIHKSEFIGPGGDGTTFYSELYNRNATDISYSCALNTTDPISVCAPNEITLIGNSKPTGPEFLNIDYTQFINPSPNRYARYRVYMEADENTACGGEPCLPELTSVNLNPSNNISYASDYIEVRPKAPINFIRLARITIDADTCATFRLARSGTEYYYNAGSWDVATLEAHRSSAGDVESHALQFANQYGSGELEVIGYLKSDSSGSSQCRIDEIDVGYK